MRHTLDIMAFWFLFLLFPALLLVVFLKTRRKTTTKNIEVDQKALSEAEQDLQEQSEKAWVVVKRFHGPAYTHTAMAEIISYLNSEGIEATYEVYGLSSADMGVTNFMLKVLTQDEARTLEALAKWEE